MVLGPYDTVSANMHVQQMQDQVLCKCLLNVQERFMIYLSVIIHVEQMINAYELNMQIKYYANTVKYKTP